jgi:RHS repeat-associated protein
VHLDEHEASGETATINYFALDHHGDTAYVMSANGQMVSHTRYYPFGQTWTQENSSPTDKMFDGYTKEGGVSSGLYYAGARFYSADVGRFLSMDAVGGNYRDPQSLNPYSYVQNKPLTYTDPTGRCIADMERPQGCGLDPSFGLSVVDYAEHYLCQNFSDSCGEHWLSESASDSGTQQQILVVGTVCLAGASTGPGDSAICTGAMVGLVAAITCTQFCGPAIDGLGDLGGAFGDTLPCVNPFGCGPGSTTLTATDNNGNPLPSGATRLGGGQGYRTKDGTSYFPLRVGQKGNHGEMGHEVSRSGQKYRNVTVDENGQITPVPGAPGEWQAP